MVTFDTIEAVNRSWRILTVWIYLFVWLNFSAKFKIKISLIYLDQLTTRSTANKTYGVRVSQPDRCQPDSRSPHSTREHQRRHSLKNKDTCYFSKTNHVTNHIKTINNPIVLATYLPVPMGQSDIICHIMTQRVEISYLLAFCRYLFNFQVNAYI